MRTAISSAQIDLTRSQTELASGRHADVGLELGSNTSRDLLWRNHINELELYRGRNTLANVQIDVIQSGLGSMRELANKFLEALTGARNAHQGQEVAKTAAQSALRQLTELLNTSHDGQYLFAGINTAAVPITDYASGAAKVAVDGAFFAAFGIGQSDPSVTNISAASMKTFVDTQFASFFDSTNWASDWSTATDETQLARVDGNQRVQATASANIEAIRKLAQAITMVFDLGQPALNQSAFEVIADKAMALTAGAVLGIGEEQSRLGISQNAISAANERISLRLTALTEGVQGFESVDKYEAATRVNVLMQQLETAYTLTGRISRLSLLNFI